MTGDNVGASEAARAYYVPVSWLYVQPNPVLLRGSAVFVTQLETIDSGDEEMSLTHGLCDSKSADNLLVAFDQVNSGPPDDLDGFVRQRLSANNLPSPWVTWTLVGLSKYRERQLWARELAFRHLMVNVPGFQNALDSGQNLEGCVPAKPEWSFWLDATDRRLELHNRVTGETITVSIGEYDADCGFDSRVFAKRFSKFHPQPPLGWKHRLEQLHPLGESLTFSLAEVMSAGCCEFSSDEDDEDEFAHLPEKVLARSDSISAFCEAWEDAGNRIWLSALVGDWIALSAAAAENGMTEIATLAQERADECRAARLNAARDACGQLIERNALPIGSHTLYVVAELAPEAVPQFLQKAFAAHRLTALYAFYFVTDTNDPSWCPEVYNLFTQHPSEYHSRTGVGTTSLAKYLVEHKYRVPEVVAMLAKDEETMAYAAFLAVEHVPEAAMGVLECALRCSNERLWCQAAAILAVLGDPRSEELCLSTIKNTQNARLALCCHMALYTMWGKEKLILEQEALRQRSRCVETGRIHRCKRPCGPHCARCRDFLAETFSSEVEEVAQHVLTYREQVIAATLPPANELSTEAGSRAIKT